jgi:hypothetical protein
MLTPEPVNEKAEKLPTHGELFSPYRKDVNSSRMTPVQTARMLAKAMPKQEWKG